MRRNPNYPRRRQLLPPINETGNISASSCTSIASNSTVTETGGNIIDSNNNNTNNNKTEKEEEEENLQESRKRVLEKRLSLDGSSVCLKCKNTFKSCEFCSHQKTTTMMKKRNSGEEGVHFRRPEPRKLMMNDPELSSMSYNPVYNIREIRTVCHSFSSLGIDKKLLDIQINHKQKQKSSTSSRRASVSGTTTAKEAAKNNFTKSSTEAQNKNSNSNNCGVSKSVQSNKNNNNNNINLLPEQVNANGKFLYI